MKKTSTSIPIGDPGDHRQRFFAQANAAYKALRDDPQSWAEVLAEREELEGTLLDDLEEEISL